VICTSAAMSPAPGATIGAAALVQGCQASTKCSDARPPLPGDRRARCRRRSCRPPPRASSHPGRGSARRGGRRSAGRRRWTGRPRPRRGARGWPTSPSRAVNWASTGRAELERLVAAAARDLAARDERRDAAPGRCGTDRAPASTSARSPDGRPRRRRLAGTAATRGRGAGVETSGLSHP
jgi:hypothetical protein